MIGKGIMKKLSKKKVILGGIFLLVLVAALFLFTRPGQGNDGPTVKVSKVNKQPLDVSISTTGTLRSMNQQDFYAEDTMTVKEIVKDVGAQVSRGETILLLDSTEILTRLSDAEGTLAERKVDHQQAKSRKVYWEKKLLDLQKQLERTQALYDMGAVSLEQLENDELELAEAEKELAANDLTSLEVRIDKAQLEVENQREKLAKTVITSPLEGTVLKMDVKEGQPVAGGTFMASVGDIANLEAECFVNEYDAIQLQTGQPVEITNEGIDNAHYKGHVSQVAPLAEKEETSMGEENKVKIIIRLDEEVDQLKPGFSITAKILIDESPEALTVPMEAVVEREGKDVVFVYNNGIAEMREVQKGLANALYQEIKGDIEPGESVITSSLENVQDKMQVSKHD